MVQLSNIVSVGETVAPKELNRFNQLPDQVAQIREYQEQQRLRAGTDAQREGTAGTGTPARPGEPGAPGTGTGTEERAPLTGSRSYAPTLLPVRA